MATCSAILRIQILLFLQTVDISGFLDALATIYKGSTGRRNGSNDNVNGSCTAKHIPEAIRIATTEIFDMTSTGGLSGSGCCPLVTHVDR